MKLRILLIFLIIGISLSSKTKSKSKSKQLFEEFTKSIEKQFSNNNLNPTFAKSNNNDLQNNNNTHPEENNNENNESDDNIIFMEKNEKEVNTLKDKIQKINLLNKRLDKYLTKKSQFNEKSDNFENEMINLIEKSETNLNEMNKRITKGNVSRIINKNNSNIDKLSNKLNDEINFLQTNLKKTNSNLSKIAGENKAKLYINSVNSLNIKNDLKTESLKAQAIASANFNFGGIKANNDGITLDSSAEIVIDDNSIPVNYLLQYHKAMEQLRKLCGNDLKQCKYYDANKTAENAISQTTLLGEIEHFRQLLDRISQT
jgi:hypothetical protein